MTLIKDPHRCERCSGILVPGEKDVCSICLRRQREDRDEELFTLRKKIDELEIENAQMKELLGRFQVVGEGISDGCRAFMLQDTI